MEWIKPNLITQWYGYISSRYRCFAKEYKNYRCKIVGMETDEKTKEIILWIMITGIKNQIISYLPKELIVDDLMLGEFSPFDARAITFYALMQLKYAGHYFPSFCITGQNFSKGKTMYVINELKNNSQFKKSAQELYRNMDLLSKFSQADLINVVSSAIQEQTIEDLQ